MVRKQSKTQRKRLLASPNCAQVESVAGSCAEAGQDGRDPVAPRDVKLIESKLNSQKE